MTHYGELTNKSNFKHSPEIELIHKQGLGFPENTKTERMGEEDTEGLGNQLLAHVTVQAGRSSRSRCYCFKAEILISQETSLLAAKAF